MQVRRKAFAYITRQTAGRYQLLLLTHPDHPEAGIQVPAGSIEEGEAPDAAVMREAFEETGLQGLERRLFLGEQTLNRAGDGLNEIHHRFFYHLHYQGSSPDQWAHLEKHRSDGHTGDIRFLLHWEDLPDGIPELIADHDFMLNQLIAHLFPDTK